MNNIRLSDLEENITSIWNVINDIRDLNEAIIETDLSVTRVSTILSGVIELYSVRFAKFNMLLDKYFKFRDYEYEAEFRDLVNMCESIISDINLVNEFINSTDMNTDKISNNLMGVEYLYDLKFNKFWNFYVNIISSQIN